jgi:hypothetical protein
MAVLRHILTAAPSSPRFICHRQRSATKPGTRVPRSLNHFTQCQNKNGHLSVTVFDLAGAEGLEPSARGFGAKSTLSVKPRVEIHSLKIHIITALSGFESAVTF